MDLGYNKPLCILAFDQRGPLLQDVFGVDSNGVTPQIEDQLERIKLAIYEGFRYAVERGLPADMGAILVDEEFGHMALTDAKFHGYTVALSTEKSGGKEFDFEYGDAFTEHLLEYRPTFAKALVRINPEVVGGLSVAEHARLAELREFCNREGIKLLIELIIPPSQDDLTQVDQNLVRFDREIRPGLERELIAVFQKEGIEADVWEMEGFNQPEDYRNLVKQAQSGGRDKVCVIALGRNAPEETIAGYLRAGAAVPGVNGFTVGRAIFLEAVQSYTRGELPWEKLVERVGERYRHFFDIFMNAKK